MGKLRVNLPGREYEILCEPGLLSRAGAHARRVIPGRMAVIVTDSNVEPLYAGTLARSLHAAGLRSAILEIPAGETSKTPEALFELWEQMMDLGMTRSDGVVALGGGVVGDLAGFAAATILRGVPLVQIPTTLLAQVDSSVGGKVAVDLAAGKNLAGAFYQPRLVLMDPACLATLPDREFRGGMAEVIKYGCIFDAGLFAELEAMGSREQVLSGAEALTLRCCDWKRRVVEADEHDAGQRMLLNFGHTLGHVYEAAYHYKTYTHGEAVAAGMVAAAKLGALLGITPRDVPGRIEAILLQYGLPVSISASMEDYRSVLVKDKKTDGGSISLILLTALGQAKAVKLETARLLALIGEAGL